MNINIYGKVIKYTSFSFYRPTFWKKNIEDLVGLLESIILNCCLKITMADLHTIGLKMRE